MQLLLIHGGGPSATLNASLVGVVDACRTEGEAIQVWGARRGLEGAADGNWAELSAISPEKLESVMRTPGSVIGASRRPLSEEDAPELARVLSGRGVDAVVYAGGNGSMGQAARLARAAADAKLGLKVVGLPNTADNDVTCTDHTPGFGSAARFYALAVRDISEDNRALPSPITVVEAIGRNTGWIAAATALARSADDDGPHLIYLPEQPPAAEQIFEDAKAAVAKWGRAVIVAGEGLRDGSGAAFGADMDRAGQPQALAGNLAHALAKKIQQATGLRARAERPGLLGRSCSWALSETDLTEAYRCGHAAAEAALGGATSVLVALRRRPGLIYSAFPHIKPFSEDPGRERKMPAEWAGDPGTGANEDYLEWLRPIVGEIPAIERIV